MEQVGSNNLCNTISIACCKWEQPSTTFTSQAGSNTSFGLMVFKVSKNEPYDYVYCGYSLMLKELKETWF